MKTGKHSPHCTWPECKNECLITIEIDPKCLAALLRHNTMKTGTVGERYALDTLKNAVKL